MDWKCHVQFGKAGLDRPGISRLRIRQLKSSGFVSSVVALITLTLLLACSSSASTAKGTPDLAEQLTIYGWEGYMPQSVLDAFSEEYGVATNYVAYGDALEAVDDIEGGGVYDLIVLGNLEVQVATQKNLLAELDYRNIPNFKHVATDFRDLAFDPQNTYSVPFQWGTTGLLYRTDLVEEPITHWADLWNPLYSGKLGLWAYDRDVIGIALKSLGYSYNTENPEEIAEASVLLMEIKDSVFFADPYLYSAVPHLINGDATIFSGWAYDMQAAEGQTEKIAYILPKEGTFIWLDNLAIPANSPNKYTAELFLNFILRPEIGAQIANEMYVAIPNEGAYPFIEPEILNDPLIFPTEEAMVGAEFFQPISAEAQALYDEVWTLFIAGVPTKLASE